MGTEILRPQDCLIRESPVSCCRRRSHYSHPNPRNGPSANPRQGRKPTARSDQKRRSGAGSGHVHTDLSKRSCDLVMEKVTILRRGESLDSKVASSSTDGVLAVFSTERLGPAPEMVPKQIRFADPKTPEIVYAGSAFSVSPAPSSLPLPSFSKKKNLEIDDSATRDLRRLLRLEF